MKVLCLVFLALLAVSQAKSLEERSIVQRSHLSQVKHFLHNAARAVGSGCASVTKYVTGPVCTALGIVPKSVALESCGIFTVGVEVCAGIIEGAEIYCKTFGFSLPGGPAADKIICDAIHRHG